MQEAVIRPVSVAEYDVAGELVVEAYRTLGDVGDEFYEQELRDVGGRVETGEVLVTMWVFGSRREYRLSHGDRIAQLVVARLAELPVVEVEALTPSARGGGGHGSTGR